MLKIHRPGFMTRDSVTTDAGTELFLNVTVNFCSISDGLSGVTLTVATTGSEFVLTYLNITMYTEGLLMCTSCRTSFCWTENTAYPFHEKPGKSRSS